MSRPDRRGDADLVQRARGGDKAAFGELLSRHIPTARALAQRLLGEHELARDVVQESAVVALLGLERLANPERFGAWLCGIALNVARRWSRQQRSTEVWSEIEMVDPDPGPDEVAETALRHRTVRRAIAGLAPGQRAAVYLFYLQGLTYRDVATELGIPIGAVKSRLHQARAALAVRLAEVQPEERIVIETAAPELADVRVAEVRRSENDESGRSTHLVVLQEIAGDRQLVIWIGPAEATALAVSLESEQMPRPMTYQFTASLLQAAGATLHEVRIAQLDGTLYYANAVLDGPAGRHSIDARPSDGLNLAALTGAPIRVDPALLSSADSDDLYDRYPTTATQLAAEARTTFSRKRPQSEDSS